MTLPNNQKSAPTPAVVMLRKSEVLRRAGGVSFPAIWNWMRAGTFPRSRLVGGLSMWRSDEIDDWINGLPVRPYRGDAAATVGSQPEQLRTSLLTARRRGRRPTNPAAA